MPRVLFTTSTVSDLKLTLSRSFKLINKFLWIEGFDYNIRQETNNSLSTFPLEPFKPNGQMRFYNNAAILLGYNNWKELESVSTKTTQADIRDAMFLNEDQALKTKFKELYLKDFITQYGIEHEEMITFISAFLSIMLGGFVFNTPFSKKSIIKSNNDNFTSLTANSLIFHNADKIDKEIGTDFGTLLPNIIPMAKLDIFVNDEAISNELGRILTPNHKQYAHLLILMNTMRFRMTSNQILITSGQLLFGTDNTLPSRYNGVILWANIFLSFFEIYYNTEDYELFVTDMIAPTKKDQLIKEYAAYKEMMSKVN